MDLIRPHLQNENDVISLKTTSTKPSSGFGSASSSMTFGSERKKGLSLITNNTPFNQRRKLANVSNTPIGSRQNSSILKHQKSTSFQKPEKSSAKKVTNLVQNNSAPLPILYEEIENAYPLSADEFRQFHFPSEMSEYYVEHFHSKLMNAAMEEEDIRQEEINRQLQTLPDDEYFCGLL